jgi:hypothetical protein
MKMKIASLLLGMFILFAVPALAATNSCQAAGRCSPGVCLNQNGKCNTGLCQKSLDGKTCGCAKLCSKPNCLTK